MNETLSPDQLRDRILATPKAGLRRVIAIAGPPASGKSTFADELAETLNRAGETTQVVPMDGFHLHNDTLIARGQLNRKGAPFTFDSAGFVHLVARLRDESNVYAPLFDRTRDIAIAGASHVHPDCSTVIVEGNYLLLDDPNWTPLKQHWDVSVMLDVEIPVLQERLTKRWLDHGLTQDQAIQRARLNDLPNAELVVQSSCAADYVIKTA